MNFIARFLPFPENDERLFAHHLDHRDPSLGNRKCDFFVDEKIVEPDTGGIDMRVGVTDN